MSFDNVNQNSDTPLASVDDAAEAILETWEDADEDQPSEDSQEATEEATDETEVEDSDETEDEETEEETEEDLEDLDEEEESETDDEDEEDDSEDETDDDEEQVEIDDETVVDIVVDGETKQASIKDLKRLYGQEASLTRKSQETSSQRKLADEQLQRADASLQAMPSKQMNSDDFAALRAEAKQAEDDLKFLSEEADAFYDFVKKQNADQKQAQAKECVKVLQKELPEWNNQLYNDIRMYAVSQGLPEDNVNQITDPNAIMLLNKARLFDQTKKVATVKKAKASKKVLRSKKAPPSKAEIRASKNQKVMDKLRADSGDLDNIAEAIMANWE